MPSLVGWKMFFSQLEHRLKSEFIVYGDYFPSAIFFLPEIAQTKLGNINDKVYIAIPKGSAALGYLMEILPSIIDVDFNATDANYIGSKISIIRAEYSNEESQGVVNVAEPSRLPTPPKAYKISPQNNQQQNKRRRTLDKHVLHQWRFEGRYNKSVLEIYIEKWNVSIDEMVKIIYDNAKHTGFIPLYHAKTGFAIPTLFAQRHQMALKSEITVLKGNNALPNFSRIGGIKLWCNVSTTK